MVVDESMLITEVSEAATDYFEKNTYIYQYNKKFSSIFADLNYVSNFRLKNENLELKNIMTDKKILQHYQTYFEFIAGEEIDILDRLGNFRSIRMKVSVVYMSTVQRFIRFIYFELKDHRCS